MIYCQIVSVTVAELSVVHRKRMGEREMLSEVAH